MLRGNIQVPKGGGGNLDLDRGQSRVLCTIDIARTTGEAGRIRDGVGLGIGRKRRRVSQQDARGGRSCLSVFGIWMVDMVRYTVMQDSAVRCGWGRGEGRMTIEEE